MISYNCSLGKRKNNDFKWDWAGKENPSILHNEKYNKKKVLLFSKKKGGKQK